MFLKADSFDLLNSIKPKYGVLRKSDGSHEFDKSIDINKSYSNICDLLSSQYFIEKVIPRMTNEYNYLIDDIYYKSNMGYLSIYSKDDNEYYWSNSYSLKLYNGVLYYTLAYSIIE